MWSYVDVWLASLAGFSAGYIMALGAYWLEAVLGLMRLDFGHTGMQYVGGEKPGWWVIGIVFHFIDSVLIGLIYAAIARPLLAGIGVPVSTIVGGVAAGLVYGTVVWLLLAMLIAMPMMGGGIFGYQTRSPRLAIFSLGLHWVYGGILGLAYLP